jgi:hypothetical protein
MLYTVRFLSQETFCVYIAIYEYFILQLKVQFDYEISWHNSEISRHTKVPRHTGWESLV